MADSFDVLQRKVLMLEERLDRLEKSDRIFFQRDLQLNDGRNIQFGTGTGTKIGTGTSQKIGFFNATPVAQQSDPGNLSLSSVSGTGDDATINANNSNIETWINTHILGGVKNLGLFG